MLRKTSEHIETLMLCEEAIRRQFEVDEAEAILIRSDADPLREKEHEVVPGLINKYGNRVLCLLTTDCAAYCRFCTRRRLIEEGQVARETVDAWVDYLADHPGVREVIISGGDPFTVDDDLFEYAMERLASVESVRVLRIGTRVPVSDPDLVNHAKLDAIARSEVCVYVGIHFEHPEEVARPTVRCLDALRAAGAILYSQTVFLKGVNDDFETLRELFTALLETGVRPYYIYRCDPIPGAMHFRVDFAREREIMTRLRSELSGLACPTYVIDTPEGSGKIPVPLDYWDCADSTYRDFDGKPHATED